MSEKDTSQEIFKFDVSGIEERTGSIPKWLYVVYVGLVAWGIYYVINYWSLVD